MAAIVFYPAENSTFKMSLVCLTLFEILSLRLNISWTESHSSLNNCVLTSMHGSIFENKESHISIYFIILMLSSSLQLILASRVRSSSRSSFILIYWYERLRSFCKLSRCFRPLSLALITS